MENTSDPVARVSSFRVTDRLFTRRDCWVWAAAFILAAGLLVATGFASDDGDSALYAGISSRLAEEPASRWIAPQWWGFWDSSGLFREHPAGVFWLPTLLDRLGIPAMQGAYIQGIAAGLGSLLLIGVLVARVTNNADGRASLVWLQFMPVAFVFRIRANHEYPMLFCLVLALVAIDGVRRSWRWLPVLAAALTGALLIKGVFVLFILLSVGLWILLNPARVAGSMMRPIAGVAISLGVMALVALVYDRIYLSATGETFWGPYWRRQLSPVTIATPFTSATSWLGHVAFYLSRLLWHPAPWSLALLFVAWQRRSRFAWRRLFDPDLRGVTFVLAFVVIVVALLTPSSRFAERYAFSATYAVAALGIVVACRLWPVLREWPTRWAAGTMTPAVIWLGLIVLRLALGPWLPRISG